METNNVRIMALVLTAISKTRKDFAEKQDDIDIYAEWLDNSGFKASEIDPHQMMCKLCRMPTDDYKKEEEYYNNAIICEDDNSTLFMCE